MKLETIATAINIVLSVTSSSLRLKVRDEQKVHKLPFLATTRLVSAKKRTIWLDIDTKNPKLYQCLDAVLGYDNYNLIETKKGYRCVSVTQYTYIELLELFEEFKKHCIEGLDLRYIEFCIKYWNGNEKYTDGCRVTSHTKDINGYPIPDMKISKFQWNSPFEVYFTLFMILCNNCIVNLNQWFHRIQSKLELIPHHVFFF